MSEHRSPDGARHRIGRLGRRSTLVAFTIVIASMGEAIAAGPLSPGIGPDTLGIIVNDADPLSVRIADYYRSKRNIPAEQIVHVSFDASSVELPAAEFARIQSIVAHGLPAKVQGLALTWARPYRVGCVSITYAFAVGAAPESCAPGCSTTRMSRYFDSSSPRPQDELQLRPTMSIAATSFDQAKQLIDRGVQSDGTAPRGTAYLLKTSDARRNVRSWEYGDAQMLVGNSLRLEVVDADQISQRTDVMFYFTGIAHVADIATNRYLPGAVADHLTSLGGQLTDSSQMSSLRWLEAGATGSYGTVVEPCNITAKFPNVSLFLKRYTAGETLLEAYWKSVAMPAQGVFIGEPLARPYAQRMPLASAATAVSGAPLR